MSFKKMAWVIPSLICACATPVKEEKLIKLSLSNPPQMSIEENKDPLSVIYYLEGLRKNTTDLTQKLWAEYRLAKHYHDAKDPRSCPLFFELSAKKIFPLHREAQVYHLQTCMNEAQGKDTLRQLQSLNEWPWLRLKILQASIEIAERHNLQQELIDLYIEKSKLPIDLNDKIEYTKKAIKLATKHFPVQKGRLKQRLYKLSPSHQKKPLFKNYLKVAYDYRRNRKFDQALWFYEAVANNKKSSHYERVKALTGISRTFKIMGQQEKHIKACENLARYAKSVFTKNKKNKDNGELVHDSYLSLARANWTQGHIQLAQKTLNIMTELLKGRHTLAQVYLTRARMSEEIQDFASAIKWLQRAEQEELNSTLREHVLWHKAWNFKKMNKYSEAAEILKALLKLETFEENRNKYTFWLAKTLKDLKDYEQSDFYFEEAITNDPYGYYGLLAHRETHDILKLPQADRGIASERVSQKDKELLSSYLDTFYLDWLIALGEGDISENYLDFSTEKMRRKDFIENNEWLALFHYYAKAGQYLKLFSQIGKIPSQQRKVLLNENPDLIFPKPYFKEVSTASQRFGLSIEYIYSIMRQESAFNPKARSHMDAFGLMQLLPEVANQYAESINLSLTKAEDLFKPHVGIPLGVAHLRELWDKYNGRFILATASYNANDKAIQSWLKTRYRGDSLEFIEDIPYKETQNYIKLVLRNMIFYKIINSANKIVSFPNWVLEI